MRIIKFRLCSVPSCYLNFVAALQSASPFYSRVNCALTFLYSHVHYRSRPSHQHSFVFRLDLARHVFYIYGTLPRCHDVLSTSGRTELHLCPSSAASKTIARKDLIPFSHAILSPFPLAAIFSISDSLVLQWLDVCK